MKFGPVDLTEAEGKILGHNVADAAGKRLLRKGRSLGPAEIETLRGLGRRRVYVAELEAGDVDENAAAERVAGACQGEGVRLSPATTGRVNLIATVLGLTRIDAERLAALNRTEGLTLATVRAHAVARPGQTVATAKIIPYALPEAIVAEAEGMARNAGPLVWVDELKARRVGLILYGAPSVRERLTESFSPLTERTRSLGSEVVELHYVNLEDEGGEERLATALRRLREAKVDLIVLAGETAIMDRQDITPRAVERAGGRVETVGAPVDPGNLLMLAYLDDVPVLGAPGCARSRKVNVIDWILPRLLAGDALGRADIAVLGAGGLLDDVPERPMPRSGVSL